MKEKEITKLWRWEQIKQKQHCLKVVFVGNRRTQLHNFVLFIIFYVDWFMTTLIDNRTDSVGRQWAALCLLARWSHVCAAACHWLHSMNVEVLEQFQELSTDHCLWAAHRAVLKPFIHLSAVPAALSQNPFIQALLFYCNIPVQAYSTVSDNGWSIWPHHLWDYLHVCFWVVNPLTTICLSAAHLTS